MIYPTYVQYMSLPPLLVLRGRDGEDAECASAWLVLAALFTGVHEDGSQPLQQQPNACWQ